MHGLIPEKGHRKSWIRTIVVLIFSAGILIGCQDERTSLQTSPRELHDVHIGDTLRTISSCNALEDARTEVLVNRVIDTLRYGYMYAVDNSASIPGVGAPETPQSVPDFTDTNLQETGVDEPDSMKIEATADGTWIYTLSSGAVHVVRALPANNAQQIATIPIPGYDSTLFLHGDQLVVLSQFYHIYGSACGDSNACIIEPAMPPTGTPNGPDVRSVVSYDPVSWPSKLFGTRIAIYDVTNPAQPTQIRVLTIEGSLITARIVDDALYLVQRQRSTQSFDIDTVINNLQLRDRLDVDPRVRAAQLDQLRPAIADEVRAAIAGTSWDILPQYQEGADGEPTDAMRCNQLFAPAALSSEGQATTLLSIDLADDQSTPQGAGVLAAGWIAYASNTSIYIARNSTAWPWIDNTMAEQKTDIHRFDLRDGHPDYVASGRVPGTIRDRFSMSEHDGILRVATTDQPNRWIVAPLFASDPVGVANSPGTGGADGGTSSPNPSDAADSDAPDTASSGAFSMVPPADTPVSSDDASQADEPAPQANNVFTLQRENNVLNILGQLRGLGPNQRIYGTRFVDDMAYVTTFRRVDPLLSIDLSNPAHPTLRGALKIPGYSNFLQSIGNGRIVGVGQAVENGRSMGLQVQLFDVTDPDHPTRQDTYALPTQPDGYNFSNSEAEYDAHAFTWYPSQDLLAVPMTDYSNDGISSALLVLHITAENGIQKVGEVQNILPVCEPNDGPCYPMKDIIHRSAFVDDALISISNFGVRISDLRNALAQQAIVALYANAGDETAETGD